MNQREQLIEKARDAFVKAWEAENERVENWDRDARGTHSRSRAGIEAALAVFEEANTPTDDEREALAEIVGTEFYRWHQDPTRHTADAILAAGFHRTVQDEHYDEGTLPKVYGAVIGALPEKAEWEIRDVVHALQNAGILFRERTVQGEPSSEEPDLPNGHAPVEKLSPFLARRVQGEPSDAQQRVADALRAHMAAGEFDSFEGLAAVALRAAAATEGGGGTMIDYAPTTATREVLDDVISEYLWDRTIKWADVEKAIDAFAAEVRASVLAEQGEPEGQRWYAACWRDDNGVLNQLDSDTILREYAEADVKRWRAAEKLEGGRPDLVVLGTKLRHPWKPVEENTPHTEGNER